jgi:uncharacterized protein (DUF885 family)
MRKRVLVVIAIMTTAISCRAAFADVPSPALRNLNSGSNAAVTKSNAGSNASPGAKAPRNANERVDQLVRDNLDAELANAPVTATWLGIHDYDPRLEDVRPEAQAREVARLRALLETLAALDGNKELDAEHAFDRFLLERRAQTALFTLTELRPLERNPMVYCDLVQAGIFELISDDFLPPADRLRAINARLWKVRPLLDDARRNLRPSTNDLAVRHAIEEAQAARSFIAETLPKALQGVPDPKLLEELRAAAVDASRALDDFAGWLQRDLLPRARGDYVLGRDRFMELLRLSEGVDVTPELLVALGERELKDARRRVDEAARQLAGGRPNVDVNKLVEEDHAKPEELLAVAQQTLEAMVAFVKAQHLVTPPPVERPKVIEMPPALWGYAQLQMAGPLEPRPRDAYLYVDPVEKGWPDRKKQEHLRAFNRSVMVRTFMHDAIGHYVQAELARHAPTTMQKIANSPLFVEGWAGYVEELLLAEGFLPGDARVRLSVARETMLRAARLVAGVKLHALGGKLDDAVKVFTDEAGLDDYQARREAERVATDPLVIADALGRIAILKFRDDWRAAHPGASLGAFHDALLRHGTASPVFLRRLLMPDVSSSPL